MGNEWHGKGKVYAANLEDKQKAEKHKPSVLQRDLSKEE